MNNVRKIGRCFNGAERDGGKTVHAIDSEKPNGDWFGKAVCGTEPGYRGNGWAKTDKPVSCTRCINKMAKRT